MRDDVEFEKMAVRIRARAMRRIGVLLTEVEPARGKNNQHAQAKMAPDCPFQSLKSAIKDAGIGETAAKEALKIASIPQAEFDERINGKNPPMHMAANEPTGAVAKEPSDCPLSRSCKQALSRMKERGRIGALRSGQRTGLQPCGAFYEGSERY
ncbi:MAG: hypothetical protein CTY39_02620 [Hyphomicrobium sp.]|nr:MAG: hypothetical protein CTY39_02620 [Hyphomicrobium sp.]